jgi:hypothetical protein
LETNWACAIHYKMSIRELENMTPWEFEFYVDLIREYVKKSQEEPK